jgi:hypothetical protein
MLVCLVVKNNNDQNKIMGLDHLVTIAVASKIRIMRPLNFYHYTSCNKPQHRNLKGNRFNLLDVYGHLLYKLGSLRFRNRLWWMNPRWLSFTAFAIILWCAICTKGSPLNIVIIKKHLRHFSRQRMRRRKDVTLKVYHRVNQTGTWVVQALLPGRSALCEPSLNKYFQVER